MTLTVVAWNMAHWTHQQVAPKAWDYLDKQIAADISLLQECVPPPDRRNNLCVWSEIGGSRRWGSGILTSQLPLKELRLPRNDHPGALTVADVTLPDQSSVIVVSMYGLLDDYHYSITNLHRMLSDLTPLFNGDLRPGRRPRVILGGDLNASVQLDPKQKNKSHRIFFERLEDFGLVDCHGPFSLARPRTLRHRRSAVPWVNDYIFASASLGKKVVSRQVVDKSEMHHLSDHNPVVVTFDL